MFALNFEKAIALRTHKLIKENSWPDGEYICMYILLPELFKRKIVRSINASNLT